MPLDLEPIVFKTLQAQLLAAVQERRLTGVVQQNYILTIEIHDIVHSLLKLWDATQGVQKCVPLDKCLL